MPKIGRIINSIHARPAKNNLTKQTNNEKRNYTTHCLKLIEKVSFNIASEASYVYILSGQKFFKNAKSDQFEEGFENLKLAVKQYYQILIGQKLVKNAKILKFKCDIFGDFQTL